MMGGREGGQDQFFYSFDLDKVVPPDHLVRQIDGVLDLGWVHKELAPYYSHAARPSIDPVLMIRMLMFPRRAAVFLWSIAPIRRAADSHLEPRFAHLAISGQRRRGTLKYHLAVAHHIDSMRDAHGDSELLLHQQDRDAASRNLLQQIGNAFDHLWRQSLGRLVDHDKIGIAHERPADR
jgi:hypothetical protein